MVHIFMEATLPSLVCLSSFTTSLSRSPSPSRSFVCSRLTNSLSPSPRFRHWFQVTKFRTRMKVTIQGRMIPWVEDVTVTGMDPSTMIVLQVDQEDVKRSASVVQELAECFAIDVIPTFGDFRRFLKGILVVNVRVRLPFQRLFPSLSIFFLFLSSFCSFSSIFFLQFMSFFSSSKERSFEADFVSRYKNKVSERE